MDYFILVLEQNTWMDVISRTTCYSIFIMWW